MTVNWFWPPSGQAARSVTMQSSGGGTVVFDCYAPIAWPFYSGAGDPPVTLAASGYGIAASSVATASGSLAAISYMNEYYGINGNVVNAATQSHGPYCGVAKVGVTNYTIGNNGTVYLAVGDSAQNHISANANYLAAFGSASLVTTSAEYSGGAAIAFIPTGSGSPTYATLPIGVSTIGALATTSTVVGVAGSVGTTMQASAGTAVDPYDLLLAAQIEGSTLSILAAPTSTSNVWTVSGTQTGLSSNLSFVTWVPNGTQIMALSAASNTLQIINYTGGALSVQGTSSLTGPAAAAVLSDSQHMLVCCSGSGNLVPYYASGANWIQATGNIIPLASPTDIVITGPDTVAISYASGICYLTLTGGVWGSPAEVGLSYAATAIATDATGQVYIGGTDNFTVFNGTTAIGSGTLPGQCNGMVAYQAQLAILDIANSAVRIYGNASGGTTWTQQSIVSGLTSLGTLQSISMATRAVFIGGSTATAVYDWNGPYQLSPAQTGIVECYTPASSAWVTVTLGADHSPSAMTFDASGNAWVSTIENDLFTINAAGTITNIGSIEQYGGAAQTIPMGSSALISSAGHIYSATCLSGVLVEAT